MAMKAIMNKYWVEYLRYWKDEVRDIVKPPTEEGFWAWYAYRILDDKHDPDNDPDTKD
jgi:hypothetical protein